MKQRKSPQLPTISIVTNTFNPDPKLFEQVLKALQKQTYPKKLVEHLVIDGGSTNETVKLAKKYKCKVVVRADLKDQEQMRASMGFKMAKGDILAVIQSDNIVTSKNWLMKMVQPFINLQKVFCAFSERNAYLKNMDVLTRYCALFGVNDPTIYYLKKTEKMRMDEKKYNKGEILKDVRDYYLVRFTKANLPPLGDNGHMFRKRIMKIVNTDEKNYMHTDALARMVDLGYDTVGVVKNSIIHAQKPNILRTIRRRIELKEKFYDKYRGKRDYLVFDPNSKTDKINLIKYLLFSLTLVQPLYESTRGYVRIRDSAWFLHPVMCILMIVGFGYSEIKRPFRKVL